MPTESPAEMFGVEPDDLLFLPLGGAGEIGMNLNLYSIAGKWLMVDLGITFAGDAHPGIDLITPDPTFIVEQKDNLLGLVLTHAHEDHLGAVPHLWTRLQCPIWATPFTAAVLRYKLNEAGLTDVVPLHEVPLGGNITIGPFAIEFVSLTHSIPEPNALVLKTQAGTVLHTGDWKLDPDPLVGDDFDEETLRRVGEDGVLALVCDSTNVFQPGTSGSEAEVRETLTALCAGRTSRIAITTFASNAARVATVAEVARRCDRHLVIVGRSLWRIIAAARQTGYLEDLGPVLEADEGAYLPPDKVLYLCTGCQGEPRGAMARIAAGDHPNVMLERGDLTIFSSKIIPGNELAIASMQNRLSWLGVEVLNEKHERIHVSGHPCQDELADMYRWVRPRIAVPVHGEHRHLVRHAELARELQVPEAVVIENGQVLRLSENGSDIVGEVQSGRWLVDGHHLIAHEHEAIRERRRMMYNGNAVITVVVDDAGSLLADPVLVMQGIADEERESGISATASAAATDAVEGASAAVRRGDGALQELVRLAVRRSIRADSGKNPVVQARIVRLPAQK